MKPPGSSSAKPYRSYGANWNSTIPESWQGLVTLPLRISIRGYQLLISPFLGNHCRFEPCCSDYALQALSKYGLLSGLWLSLRRLLRCHPWGGGCGYDPVPERPSAHPHRH